MRSTLVGILLAGTLAALLFFVSATPPAPAGPVPAADEPLAARVRLAIDKGKGFLTRQQQNGAWAVRGVENALYPTGGTVSLAMLAILTCGDATKDDQAAIQAGLTVLRSLKATPGDDSATYVVGLQTMVFAMNGDPADQAAIQDNVKWLLGARLDNGYWSYGYHRGGEGDGSNTQYALLALHEAKRAGVVVDEKAMKSIQQFYLDAQHKAKPGDPDGGGWFAYQPGQGASMTMTTAGLCGLLITGMDIEADRQRLQDDGSALDCGKYEDNVPVARALQWIGDDFPAKPANVAEAGMRFATGRLKAPFYGFYGIERAGRLTGRRFIGGHDWYRVGCQCLVDSQNGDGSWSAGTIDGQPIVATSFALLFLGKGRTPVLMTKLAYGLKGDVDWDHKHNDLRNVVEFAGKELFKKQPMAWQIFDIRDQGADNDDRIRELTGELLESPVVFFSGHEDVPVGNQVDLLKKYLENGGFVFAEACCNSKDFDRKFRELVPQLIPGGELRPLDPAHPLYSASGKFISDPGRFPLEGVEQGCKTLLVYSPRAISGYWEANDTTSKDGAKAFATAANVIAYATGLEAPRQKGDSIAVAEKEAPAVKRGFLEAAQLRYGGDWHPAPNAMHNLMTEARTAGLDVALDSKATEFGIDPGDPNITRYRFLYMHGRGAFSFKEMKSLRFDLEENGALLLADACCGNREFDDSFRKFMEELWADHKDKPKLQPIPPDDELFGEALNGKKIDKVMCRRETPDGKGVDTEFRSVAPALEGIKINGRWVVIYSRYDIGCALERHPTPGCMGHDFDSAVALGKAAVLYALKR